MLALWPPPQQCCSFSGLLLGLLYGYNYMKSRLAAGLNSVLCSPFNTWWKDGVSAGLVLGLLLEKNCTPPADCALSFLSEVQYLSVKSSL